MRQLFTLAILAALGSDLALAQSARTEKRAERCAQNAQDQAVCVMQKQRMLIGTIVIDVSMRSISAAASRMDQRDLSDGSAALQARSHS